MAVTDRNIYYPDDYDEVADVPEDMRKLAESVDSVLGSLDNAKVNKVEGKGLSSNDFTDSYKNKVDSLENYDDTEIREEITELKQEDELIKKDIRGIAILGQAQGENITLNDSAECRLQDIKIEGNTEQATRSGKNLYNAQTKTDNVAFTWNAGATFSEDESIVSDYIPKSNLTSLYSNYSFIAFYYDSNKTYLGNGPDLITSASTNAPSTTIPNNSSIEYIRIEWRSTFNLNADMTEKTDIMLTKTQTELIPYETYGVSPSPDYPSDIRNIGDNINKFNWTGISNTNVGTFENGIATLNWDSGFDCFLLSSDNQILSGLDSTKTYTISFKHKGDKIVLKDYQTSGNSVTTGNTNDYTMYSFSIAGVTSIRLDINRSDTTGTAYIKEIKVEKGIRPSSYSPYNCSNFDIKVINKNIFNGFRSLGANATYNNGILSISASGAGAICYGNYLIPSGNRQYYFSYNSSYATARYYIVEYDENYTQIRSTSKTAQTSFTIGSDAVYFSIVWNFASGTTFPLTISNMQLEAGTTATSYIAHQEQNIIFPLSQGQRLMKGDYLADDGIHHVRGQVVLDGSEDESWTANGSNQGYGIHINGIGGLDIDSQSADAYCNCLKKGGQVLVYQGLSDNVFSVRGGNTSKIYVRYDSSITTVTLLRQQLSSQPITVEYELAEEVVEAYTEEQQAIYYQIKNLHSYKETTNIYSENEISPKFDVEYAKDLEIIINNLTSAIVALGGELDV